RHSKLHSQLIVISTATSSLTRLYTYSLFFFYCSAHHRDLHSFPTRRSSDLLQPAEPGDAAAAAPGNDRCVREPDRPAERVRGLKDRKSTRLNSSHVKISYAVFCLKKKKNYKRKEWREAPIITTMLIPIIPVR